MSSKTKRKRGEDNTKSRRLSSGGRRFALSLVVCVTITTCTGRSALTQTLHRAVSAGRDRYVICRRRPVTNRDAYAVRYRLNVLRLRYVADVFLAGWQRRLLLRQPPATFRLLFARTGRTGDDFLAALARRRDAVLVRETPQVNAAVHARADYKLTVRAYPHVGHDARVANPDVRGHPLLVQPHLHHLIRASSHNVLACGNTIRLKCFYF